MVWVAAGQHTFLRLFQGKIAVRPTQRIDLRMDTLLGHYSVHKMEAAQRLLVGAQKIDAISQLLAHYPR